MNLSDLAGDEGLFLRRLEDMARIAAQKGVPRFSAFLNERQACIAGEFARQSRTQNACFYGGYPKAERKLCGFFLGPPEDGGAESGFFPVTAVTVSFSSTVSLSHRDFLGSLMALGIKRESVGDILVSEGICTIFLLDSVLGLVLSELEKVGNTSVKCAAGYNPATLPEVRFENVRGTVSSARIDSLVRLLTGLAREKSAALIHGGLVSMNHREAESVSAAFKAGDTVSIRGCGRFLVDSIGPPTKKGRLPVAARKYL